MVLIWKLAWGMPMSDGQGNAWDMPMNNAKGNEYHAINNTIDKQLSSLNVKIYFFVLWVKGKQKVVKVVAQSEVYAIHG